MHDWLRRNLLEQNIDGQFKQRNYSRISNKLFIVGLVNGIFAMLLFVFYGSSFEKRIEYSTDLKREISLPKATKTFMYIELNYNQANLKYIKSIDYAQLKGETENLNLERLNPYGTLKGKPFYPAGELPDSFFQDAITLDTLNINQENITFKSNLKRIGITSYTPDEIQFPASWTKYTNEGSNPLNFVGDQKLPILNERFINWIDLTLFYPTKKLWATIATETDRSAILSIDSMSEFEKQIIFTHGSFFGFRNFFIPFMALFISLICVANAILFMWVGQLQTQR